MKRLIVLLTFLSVAVAASAQYAPAQLVPSITIKGSRVFAGDQKLSRSEAVALFSDVQGVDRSAEYLRYRSAYKTGLGLTIGGSVLTVGGGVSFVGGLALAVAGGITIPLFAGIDVVAGTDSTSEYSSEVFGKANIMLNVGLFATLGGMAMLASGIPTMSVYNSRLNRIEADYNKSVQTPVELTFGPQRHGFGFAMTF